MKFRGIASFFLAVLCVCTVEVQLLEDCVLEEKKQERDNWLALAQRHQLATGHFYTANWLSGQLAADQQVALVQHATSTTFSTTDSGCFPGTLAGPGQLLSQGQTHKSATSQVICTLLADFIAGKHGKWEKSVCVRSCQVDFGYFHIRVHQEDDIPTRPISTTISASTSKSVMEAVNVSTSQVTTPQASVLTTDAIRAINESITRNPTPSSPNTTQQVTQGTTTQPPIKVTTTAANKSSSTTNTTQESGTQLAQNVSLDVSSTKGWSFPSTTSLQNNTSSPGTPDFGNPGSSSANEKVPGSAIHYSSVILPIVITLIVITLSVFSLVALYRMCQKKTPERQDNGTEQAQSDKEGVKLLSVKTTSPETVFVEVRDIYEVGFSLPSANIYEPTAPPPSGEVSQGRTTGEHSSQGKNKTRQLFTPQQ
ncbi:endomucin [Aegotheles albertisi]